LAKTPTRIGVFAVFRKSGHLPSPYRSSRVRLELHLGAVERLVGVMAMGSKPVEKIGDRR
jgi:hypothetical protein